MLQPQFIVFPAILILLGISSFITLSIGRRREKADRYYEYGTGVEIASLVTGCLGAMVLIGLIIGLAPYNMKYYLITAHTGTVETVSNQFVNGSGDNTNQAFIVTFAGDKTPYELTDNRASVLDEKTVTLNCTTEFVWMGADRMNCVIGEVR